MQARSTQPAAGDGNWIAPWAYSHQIVYLGAPGRSGKVFHRAVGIRSEHQRLTVALDEDPRPVC